VNERSPILQWKVLLVLVVIVVAAASLASALRSSQRASFRTFYGSGLNGGWTGYRPLTGKMTAQTRRVMCVNFSTKFPKTSAPLRPYVKRAILRACHKRRWLMVP